MALAALPVSALTLFSGFGLGTLLMPVFALFFPVDVAIAATALVHALNNAFKLPLFGRGASWSVVKRFGLPAVAAAFLGAAMLESLAGLEPLVSYSLGGRTAEITPVKLIVAALIFSFALFELLPSFRRLTFEPRYLTAGGVLSGFFGGLSGHQGALRSAFLVKAGLNPEQFVGTNAVIGFLVDLTRILVYGATFASGDLFRGRSEFGWSLVAVAVVSAFAGLLLGRKFLKKVTMKTIQVLTGTLLLIVAAALGCGVI